MDRQLARALALAAGLACGAVASPALAFERQWHAGLDAGGAALDAGDRSLGFGGGAHLGYGLDDAWNAMLEVDVTRHPSQSMTIASGAVGVAYTLDVLRWVPYLGVLGGGYWLGDGATSRTAPGVQLALGVDYQCTRHFALGAQLRLHQVFAAEPLGTTSYATTFARAEWTWGY